MNASVVPYMCAYASSHVDPALKDVQVIDVEEAGAEGPLKSSSRS